MDVPDTLPAGQYIIYALVDPTDGLVHYVGQTYQPKERLMAHLRTRHRHGAKAEWVRLLQEKGQKPLMQVLERVSGKRVALIKEREWICRLQEQGMPLLNAIPTGTPPLLQEAVGFQEAGGQPLRGPENTGPLESKARRQREECVLNAAVSLLLRWGYRKTRLNDVAYKAGVSSVTFSLPWRYKSELFQAAIFREKRRVNEDIARRIATDSAGESFHRVIAHSLLAILSNPLMAAIVRRQPDIFTGELETYGPDFIGQLVADFDTYIAQLQGAGLIRVNFPVPVGSFLLDALKIDITNLPDLMGQKQMPSMEQLTEAISDLLHRWLETKQPHSRDEEEDEVS